MLPRRLRLRFSRRIRANQKRVENLSSQAEQQIERHLFQHFDRFNSVRRFIFSWLGLLLIIIIGLVIENLNLSSYYQTLKPIAGGVLNEGILGTFTNANPLFATNNADSSVSHLVFSGLFKYDKFGNLIGDLAKSYSTTDHGSTYVVRLKPNLSWHDGEKLTSSDVVYTYKLIQNPDVKSPLQSSWQNIKIAAPNSNTIVFSLPGSLASFPYNLTNGIVPRHVLTKIPPTDLRSANFNTENPIGSGPFKWHAIQVSSNNDPKKVQLQIALDPFDKYTGGKPKLTQYIVRVFADQKQLINALTSGQVNAIDGINDMPAKLVHKSSIQQHNFILRAENMIFFKTSSGVLSDKSVRNALVQAANVPALISHLNFSTLIVNEPFLGGQLGYDPTLTQHKYDASSANLTLINDGWTKDSNGILTKNGSPLAFSLSAADNPESHKVGSQLQSDWSRLGVKISVDYLDAVDFQNSLKYHTYDAILDGITIGEDPDVFAYWDSAQADIRSASRLNLSEYSNPTADQSLEAGRSRISPTIRTAKYKPFLLAWQQDSPALGLYQPRSLYLTNGNIAGLEDSQINSPTDRYNNVQNWEIRQTKVTDN